MVGGKCGVRKARKKRLYKGKKGKDKRRYQKGARQAMRERKRERGESQTEEKMK